MKNKLIKTLIITFILENYKKNKRKETKSELKLYDIKLQAKLLEKKYKSMIRE